MKSMVMKRLVAAFIPAVWLVASCAGSGTRGEPRYVNPDVTDAKMKEELASCRADSEEAVAEVKKGVAQTPERQNEFIDQCMNAKGFSLWKSDK